MKPSSPTSHAAYDQLAWFYNRFWGEHFHDAAIPILEQLLLRHLNKNAKILDVCCGAGHLTALLVQRGFTVTGIDGSAAMLSHAQARLPGSEFIHADAANFSLPQRFDAAVSTFDSFNHILELESLRRALANVFESLKPGGRFVFDMNVEEAYLKHWNHSSVMQDKEDICILRGHFDAENKIGHTEITLITDGEQVAELHLMQRCYAVADIVKSLAEVGFSEVNVYDAARDLQMTGHLAVGRNFYTARKPAKNSNLKKS